VFAHVTAGRNAVTRMPCSASSAIGVQAILEGALFSTAEGETNAGFVVT